MAKKNTDIELASTEELIIELLDRFESGMIVGLIPRGETDIAISQYIGDRFQAAGLCMAAVNEMLHARMNEALHKGPLEELKDM